MKMTFAILLGFFIFSLGCAQKNSNNSNSHRLNLSQDEIKILNSENPALLIQGVVLPDSDIGVRVYLKTGKPDDLSKIGAFFGSHNGPEKEDFILDLKNLKNYLIEKGNHKSLEIVFKPFDIRDSLLLIEPHSVAIDKVLIVDH